jgi:hypothetical protein
MSESRSQLITTPFDASSTAAQVADAKTMRYYPGPDAVAIPHGKPILGAESYWQEFRNAVVGDPSDLWNTLMPKPGTTPVQMEV